MDPYTPYNNCTYGIWSHAILIAGADGCEEFAYCLNSRDLHDTPKSGELILDYRDGETEGLGYTPLRTQMTLLLTYYSIGVKDTMMGEKLMRIPQEYLAPGYDLRVGLMIDAGFVAAELKKQLSKYKRVIELEAATGLTLCYNFTGENSTKIPDLTYQFSSRAHMVVPGKNYFVSQLPVASFPIITDATTVLEFTLGPSIILRNSQHADYYVELDLRNECLGFRQ